MSKGRDPRNRAERRKYAWRKCEACSCRLKMRDENPTRVFNHFRVCLAVRTFGQKQFPYLIRKTLEIR